MADLTQAQVFGVRVPKDYFISGGIGETDLGGGDDPWETGSYDLALKDAKIHNFNIIQYTSVMPKNAVRHEFEDIKDNLYHGAVLETIMANVNGKQGETITAGIITADIHLTSDGSHLGGFVCEYQGKEPEEIAKQTLHDSMHGLVDRRFDSNEVKVSNIEYHIKSLDVKKKFGTVISLVGYVSYMFPKFEL
jgi:arginine decarboxylase